MQPENAPEIIARGACLYRGHILLCRNRKKGNVYLPGGHLEGEERAPDALRRELAEELGLRCAVGRLLGVVQHAFDETDHRVTEINFVFTFRLPRATLRQPPASAEEKLEFIWWPLTSLARSRLEPRIVARLLPGWLRAGTGPNRWASTF
ncbi:MAG: NUDIX domain-containing protein [Verrucomicrobia bacterium]|nr:MAG: NUDIX domain-containing protein [Verrucomicrobiota bacterium]